MNSQVRDPPFFGPHHMLFIPSASVIMHDCVFAFPLPHLLLMLFCFVCLTGGEGPNCVTASHSDCCICHWNKALTQQRSRHRKNNVVQLCNMLQCVVSSFIFTHYDVNDRTCTLWAPGALSLDCIVPPCCSRHLREPAATLVTRTICQNKRLQCSTCWCDLSWQQFHWLSEV